MTDDNDRGQLDFSRRKLLGSVATIGAAGALGGAGSMAFFSDDEVYANNQLTAGELDLVVDWEEYYSDWSEDEDDDTDPDGEPNPYGSEDDDEFVEDGNFDVVMTTDSMGQPVPGDVPAGYTGLPTPTQPLIAVPNGYLDDFQRNAALEAFPDANDDGLQDVKANGVTPDFPDLDQEDEICEVEDANLPDALNSDLRTDEYVGEPLVLLDDVKPGDFGEVTLSFHLCDNDGYVWLVGRFAEELTGENGTNEPEEADEGELDGVVELLDEIRVTVWYDYDTADGQAFPEDDPLDGDNKWQPGDGEVSIVENVSLRSFLALLETTAPGQNVPGIPLDCNPAQDGGIPVTTCNTNPQGDWSIDFSVEQDEYFAGPNDELRVFNVIRDGEGDVLEFNYQADPEQISDDFLGICTQTINGDIQGGAVDRCDSAGIIGQTVDEPIDTIDFNICQREFIPVGERDCCVGSTTYHIGVAWWLPVNHANEIQSDSVGFDLGFYTEQCRHNDGSGIANTDDFGNNVIF